MTKLDKLLDGLAVVVEAGREAQAVREALKRGLAEGIKVGTKGIQVNDTVLEAVGDGAAVLEKLKRLVKPPKPTE